MTSTFDDNPFGIHFGPAVLEAPEFYWQSFLGALVRYRDEEGRPLGEGTAPRRYREHVPMEMRTCPYPGTRHHHALQMNVSALRQVTDHWKAVVGGIAVLRDAYLSWVTPPVLPLTLSSFWKVSRLGLMLPAYLLRRTTRRYADGTLPAIAAIIYKIMLGVNRIAERQTMMAYGSDLYAKTTVADASTLYAFTEMNQLFIGRHSVCAGTPAMADEVFGTLLSGRSSIEVDRAPMRELLDDGAMAYFSLVMRLDTEKAVFNVLTTCLLHDLVEEIRAARDPAQPAALVVGLEDLIRRTDAISPLSLEIARAPRAIRDRVVNGAIGLCAELDQELVRITGRGVAVSRPEIDPERAARATADLVGVLRSVLGWNGPSVAAFASALFAHFAQERHALHVFQVLQDRIDHILGRPPGDRLAGEAITEVYGAKLRDLVGDPLQGAIMSDANRTLLILGGHELEL